MEQNRNNKQNKQEYYLGLDIGTNSVGYAVTDTEYKLRKFKGEPMWGVHIFESASTSAERRVFRTARRRIDRRQQRVHLTQELFAKEISKLDPNFYTRIAESALCKDDRSTENIFFVGQLEFTKEYNKKYPTVHHLICELIDNPEPHDVRLVYFAVAYLMAHRGHFLKEVDKENIDAVLNFNSVYDAFLEVFTSNDLPIPWNCIPEEFGAILKQSCGVKEKTVKFRDLLYRGGKIVEVEALQYNCASMLNLLCGGKESLAKLYGNEELKELGSISLSAKDEELEKILTELGDDAALLIQLKNLYDWSILTDMLNGHIYLSSAKKELYEQHKKDLAYLKAFVKKYCPKKYHEIFRYGKKDLANYVAYSYNLKSLNEEERLDLKRKASKDEFCDYIKGIVSKCSVEADDQNTYEEMLSRLKDRSFMPKQVNTDNRVIPYQLYWYELKSILSNAESYLPFLSEEDEDGYSVTDKLLSVFEFRIPYFVGPLRKDNSKFAWIERKADGKIYPWNFNDLVDLDASEKAFIDRMTNNCTYLPCEKVLPKRSLLYQEFEVLNELNNVRIDGCKIPVTLKQEIVDELFKKKKSVTIKQIKGFLAANGIEGELSGLDIKLKASMSSYCSFRRLFERSVLSYKEAEEIIERFTYTESKARAAYWLEQRFPNMSKDDQRYISSLRFNDFGRLSKRFLTEIYDINPCTGEMLSIIDALRNTQENLMQLLSSEHKYKECIESISREYYQEHAVSLSKRLDELHVSSAVKRPITRTLDVVSDLQKVCGEPKRIFVEMARGVEQSKKNKRTKSRRETILEYYKGYSLDEIRQLSEELESKGDRELQSEALYLYFIQLGKCMYSGEKLDINLLKTEAYNIDHIYPRSKVKDDSIDNKVLVLSEINGGKRDLYPIDSNIRRHMYGFWRELHEKNLISDEKWCRLTRSTGFSNDEKWGFINRQLVETRQSTKVIATLLKERFPNSEICYVKAGLVSDYRQSFDLLKSRSANDLHHAKDAYLNIVVGNVWHNCFSKNWFNPDHDEYSIKVETLFGYERKCGGTLVWNGSESIARVRKTMSKNAVHLTRYAFCRHSGLFDQMPLKAGASDLLVPRKADLPSSKYGGYAKTTASFFSLVKYKQGKKTNMIVMPVELMVAEKYRSDVTFAIQYAQKTIGQIVKKEVFDIEFPLGKRELKINTVFSFNRFRACLGAKDSGGLNFTFYSQESLIVDIDKEKYIKRLESFFEKRKNAPSLRVQEKHDKISSSNNMMLYDYYTERFGVSPYVTFWGKLRESLAESRSIFSSLPIEEQVECLLHIGEVFKSNRSGGCDLTLIGGVKNSAICRVSSSASNWLKFNDVRIIDVSASGLFETRSQNLLELL